jgi:hypothetical protein
LITLSVSFNTVLLIDLLINMPDLQGAGRERAEPNSHPVRQSSTSSICSTMDGRTPLCSVDGMQVRVCTCVMCVCANVNVLCVCE